MPINYYKLGADTGLADSDAIQPLENGEPVEELYLNRPSGNLQNRTEVARQEIDTLQALLMGTSGLTVGADIDAKLIFYSDSGYKFRVNTTGVKTDVSNRGLYVFPITSMAKKSGNAPIYAQLKWSLSSPGPADLTLTSKFKVAEGGHNIQFRVFMVPGESSPSLPAVTIEGAAHPATPASDIATMPVTIAVQLKADGTTTVQQVKEAIEANVPATSLVTAAYSGTSFMAFDLGPQKLYTEVGSRAGLDAEGIYISAATLETFFGSNVMADGSCLVVDMTDAKTRRAQDPGTTITVDNLAIIKTDHTNRNIGECDGIIPLAKVFDGYLYLLNGKVFTPDVSQYVRHSDKVGTLSVDTVDSDLTRGLASHNLGSLASPWATLYLDYLGTTVLPAGTSGTLNLGDASHHFGTIYVDNVVGGGGGSPSMENLTITGNLTAGDADADTHTFKGAFSIKNTGDTTQLNVSSPDYNVGIGAAANASYKLLVTGAQKLTSDLRVGSDATPHNLVVDVSGNYGHVGINTEAHASAWLYVNGDIRQAGPTLTAYLGSISSDNDTDLLACRTGLAPYSHDAVVPTIGDSVNIWSEVWTRGLNIKDTAPYLKVNDTNASTDQKIWALAAADNLMTLKLWNTAEDASNTLIEMERDGYVGEKFKLTMGSAGGITSILQVGEYSPALNFYDKNGGTNETMWRLQANAGVLYLQTLTDGGATPVDILSVDRTGTTVDSITFGAKLLPTSAQNIGASGSAWGVLYASYIGQSMVPLGASVDLGSTDNRWLCLYTKGLDFSLSLYTAASSGVGSIKMAGGSGDNDGFIKVYVAGGNYYIPVWDSISA